MLSMAYDNEFAAASTNGKDGGQDYPHPLGPNTPKGDNGGKGYAPGGSGADSPSYKSGHGGFGNITLKGMLPE